MRKKIYRCKKCPYKNSKKATAEHHAKVYKHEVYLSKFPIKKARFDALMW